jgi:hypothetical protein
MAGRGLPGRRPAALAAPVVTGRPGPARSQWCADHPGTAGDRQLDGDAADAARGPVDQERRSRANVEPVEHPAGGEQASAPPG